MQDGSPLAPGTIYLCRGDDFPERNGEEWGSEKPVVPVANIAVCPEDFPFRHGVFGFNRQRMQELTRAGMAGFPWFEDEDLYPIRPSEVLIDGRTHRLE